MPDAGLTAEFTGERVIPGQVDADLLNEHLSRYAFARRFALGRHVLDLGCGAGYGSSLLAEVAEHVTGIDQSNDALDYARDQYTRPNLTFEQGDAAASRSTRFGLITAFEVIEHLDDWRGMLTSAREALTDDGLLAVSTPNKPLYAEARGHAGGNPFHIHEFDYTEFRDALHAQFPYVQLFVQNHSAGILFSPVLETARVESSLGHTSGDINSANYFLALCSRQPLPPPDHFFWIASSANLLRDRDRHIQLLAGEIELKTMWEENTRNELRDRNQEYQEVLALYRNLQRDVESRNRWAAEQDALLLKRGERIFELQAEAEAAHADYAEVAAAYEQQMALLAESHRQAAAWGQETERRLMAELDQRGAALAQCVELLHAAERTVEERTVWAQSLDREIAGWHQRFQALQRSLWVRLGHRFKLMPDLR